MEYFISDLHLGHKRIICFERTDCKTIEEHDDKVIETINSKIKATDTLYVLGDVGDLSRIPEIKGRKILLKGNHDKRSDKEYKGYFAEVIDYPFYITNRIFLSHYPHPVEDHVLNVHGHLHGAIVDKKNYLNVSAYLVNYMPVSIKELQKITSELPQEKRKFLCEWYKEDYKFLVGKDNEVREDVLLEKNGKIKYQETVELRRKMYRSAE